MKFCFKVPGRIEVIVFGVCFLLGIYACMVEPFMLKISRWDVSTSKWQNDKPLRIALLSDSHAIWPWMSTGHLEDIVREASALKPDVILLLGDYVGTHPFGWQLRPENGVEPFTKLSAPCGVFAVLGNHDLHESRGWPEALLKTGIPVLRNEAIPLDCEGRKFWVAGLDELWYGEANIQKTMAKIPDKNPVIMMMHNPDSFHWMSDSVALSVAGHTHGGQVRLPFIGAVSAVIPSKFGKRYVYGHIIENNKDLVVTSGLGMTGLPIRFMTLPEISLVTLKNNDPDHHE